MVQGDHALLLEDTGSIVDGVGLEELGCEQVASHGCCWPSQQSAALLKIYAMSTYSSSISVSFCRGDAGCDNGAGFSRSETENADMTGDCIEYEQKETDVAVVVLHRLTGCLSRVARKVTVLPWQP